MFNGPRRQRRGVETSTQASYVIESPNLVVTVIVMSRAAAGRLRRQGAQLVFIRFQQRSDQRRRHQKNEADDCFLHPVLIPETVLSFEFSGRKSSAQDSKREMVYSASL